MKFLFTFVLLFSLPTFASVDIRMSLGRTLGDPESLNENVPGALQMSGSNILGFDIIGNPTGLGGFGGGLRFDNYSQTTEDGGLEMAYHAVALNLLLNYRVINTNIYAGPILSIGMAHSADVTVAEQNYSAEKTNSYSLGAEGGLHLGNLAIGGEMGMLKLKSRDLKNESGGFLVNTESGGKKNASFSGVYFRFQVGVRF